MTRYEIAERIRDLAACDIDEIIEEIYALAQRVEDDANTYTFKAERENGEWVEGCMLVIDGEEYRIATSCLRGDDENLLTVCAYEVDPDTIEEVCE